MISRACYCARGLAERSQGYCNVLESLPPSPILFARDTDPFEQKHGENYSQDAHADELGVVHHKGTAGPLALLCTHHIKRGGGEGGWYQGVGAKASVLGR